jgi:hypothetical protein
VVRAHDQPLLKEEEFVGAGVERETKVRAQVDVGAQLFTATVEQDSEGALTLPVSDFLAGPVGHVVDATDQTAWRGRVAMLLPAHHEISRDCSHRRISIESFTTNWQRDLGSSLAPNLICIPLPRAAIL